MILSFSVAFQIKRSDARSRLSKVDFCFFILRALNYCLSYLFSTWGRCRVFGSWGYLWSRAKHAHIARRPRAECFGGFALWLLPPPNSKSALPCPSSPGRSPRISCCISSSMSSKFLCTGNTRLQTGVLPSNYSCDHSHNKSPETINCQGKSVLVVPFQKTVWDV